MEYDSHSPRNCGRSLPAVRLLAGICRHRRHTVVVAIEELPATCMDLKRVSKYNQACAGHQPVRWATGDSCFLGQETAAKAAAGLSAGATS